MRETIAEWAFIASGNITTVGLILFPVVFVIGSALATFKRTRAAAALVFLLSSYLVSVGAWFYGTAVTFASFGWVGLFIGLGVLGLGVVPLGIIGGFLYIDAGVGWGILAYAELGATDYIVKPFSPTELTARVRAALRRRAEPEPFVLDDLVIHLRATPGAGGGPSGAVDGHGVRRAPRAVGQRGTGADQRGPAPAGVGRAGRGRREAAAHPS